MGLHVANILYILGKQRVDSYAINETTFNFRGIFVLSENQLFKWEMVPTGQNTFQEKVMAQFAVQVFKI